MSPIGLQRDAPPPYESCYPESTAPVGNNSTTWEGRTVEPIEVTQEQPKPLNAVDGSGVNTRQPESKVSLMDRCSNLSSNLTSAYEENVDVDKCSKICTFCTVTGLIIGVAAPHSCPGVCCNGCI